jgi:hypothetical protein
MRRFFKNKPRAGAPLALAGIAEGLAQIEYALLNMRVENGRVSWSQLGAPTISFGDNGAGTSPAFVAELERIYPPPRFGCSVGGSSCRVRAGSVRFHGIGIAHCAATSLELAMSPTWVSVAVSRASLSAEIVATSTEPQSDYATLYLPLVVIEGVTAEESTSWRIIERCHEGDFDFDLPLR